MEERSEGRSDRGRNQRMMEQREAGVKGIRNKRRKDEDGRKTLWIMRIQLSKGHL